MALKVFQVAKRLWTSWGVVLVFFEGGEVSDGLETGLAARVVPFGQGLGARMY